MIERMTFASCESINEITLITNFNTKFLPKKPLEPVIIIFFNSEITFKNDLA